MFYGLRFTVFFLGFTVLAWVGVKGQGQRLGN
jgi:hypothetical protein